MRAATTAYVGVGATAAVLVAGLVQAAAEDTAIGQALGVSVPAEYRAQV
ncbi:hypothetical protein [Streptomyces rubiginosohelvolus]